MHALEIHKSDTIINYKLSKYIVLINLKTKSSIHINHLEFGN